VWLFWRREGWNATEQFNLCSLLQMLKKIKTEATPEEDKSTAELDALKHTDWVRGRECVCVCVSERVCFVF